MKQEQDLNNDPKIHSEQQWKKECVSLQRLLKEQHSMLWTQNQQKISFEKKLSDSILAYHRNKIQALSNGVNTSNKEKVKQKESKKISTKLKQAFDMGDSKIASKSQPTDDKVLLADEGFGDSCFYIKQILLSLSKDPELMLTIIRKHHAIAWSENTQSVVKAIVHSIYENIVDDDIYNKDIFIILNECFRLIVSTAKWYTDVKLGQDKSIAAMIARQFLEKTEIKNYSKQILRNMVLEISKIDHEVSFLAEENEKDGSKAKDSTGSLGFSNIRPKKNDPRNDSPVKDQKLNQKSKLDNTNSKINQFSQALQVKDQKMRASRYHSSQKQKQKASVNGKNKKCASKQLLKYLGITEEIQFPTFVSSTANSELKKQEEINKQWAAMLNQKQSMAQINGDIILIKNIVLIFFSDLFKMLYTFPLSLRIACKIFYEHLEKKYSSKKGCFYVLAEYMLGLCVMRYIQGEDTVGEKIAQKGDKNKPVNHVKSNLSTFSKIIMSVVKNDFKNIPKSFEHEFNMIVSNLRISLYNYMTEIVNIDSTKINNLILKRTPKQSVVQPQSIQKIKSYSVLVTISDVKRIFEMIKMSRTELMSANKNQKLIKRIERIEMVTEGKDIFGEREDKRTRLIYKPENAYIMFYELELPKQLSVNYIKYHDNYFKNDKFKKMMKLFLLSIQNVENFPEFHQEKSLFGFLKVLSLKPKEYFDVNSMIKIENIDHVAVEVKIKYLVSLIKNNYTENQYSSFLFDLILALYREAIERTYYYKTVWDKSKESYLKALSSAIYLNQTILNSENVIAKNIKSKKLDEFIAKTKIAVCLTSPKTREKDIVSKTNIVKDLAEDQKSKIWLENQTRCIHTTLNLEFIKSLTGQPDKIKKEDSHCNSIMKFADVLCSLPEIKANNAQDIGVKEAFYDFIKYCTDLALKQEENGFGSDSAWLEQSLEQKLSKKIYDKLYPKDPSYEDVAFYLRLKTLDFVGYSHLKIKPCLRNDKMWQLAGRQLRMMDKVKTAGQKLNCINECVKIIVNSYHLINDSDDPASAEDIYPLVIYVLIKAAPKRMISNMTQLYSDLRFIEYFANENKLKEKQGYAFSQVKSAIQFCDSMTEENLEYENISYAQKVIQFRKQFFDKFRTIYEKQIEYGIYFLLLRKNTSHEVEANSIKFLKDFFSTVSKKAV